MASTESRFKLWTVVFISILCPVFVDYCIILAIILNAEESYRIRGNIFFKQRFDDFVEEMFL